MRRCGPVIGKRQAEDLAVQAAVDAVDIDAFYRARIPEPCTPARPDPISSRHRTPSDNGQHPIFIAGVDRRQRGGTT
jgi:hypothetical protein